MRELTSHKVNGLNEAIDIQVEDERGEGNANHVYLLVVARHPDGSCAEALKVRFQNGPLQETKPNGISNEALLAIVEDRLLGFQSGEFACRENAVALTKIQEAMLWLQKRTRDRLARGVEGTMEK